MFVRVLMCGSLKVLQSTVLCFYTDHLKGEITQRHMQKAAQGKCIAVLKVTRTKFFLAVYTPNAVSHLLLTVLDAFPLCGSGVILQIFMAFTAIANKFIAMVSKTR